MANSPQPTRHLDLEGTYNVRDLGGYRTADGRTTRWRTFLRADSLHRLSAESQASLIDYGLQAAIDLRGSSELEERPSVFSGSSDVVYYHRNLLGDEPLAGTEYILVREASERIANSYTSWLDLLKPRFGEVLATLAEPGARPAIFHCASGQDRTGIISALLLCIAGVPAETIAEDYGLSAPYLRERYLAELAPPELSPEEFTWQDYQAESCPPEAMLEMLEHLEDEYGGVQGYLRAVGLTQDQVESLRDALVG